MKRTRLKAVSDKRRVQLSKYRKLREQFLTLNPTCQVCGRKRSTQVHHTNSRFGKRLLDTEYWLAICWEDHARVHNDPRWARENGYL